MSSENPAPPPSGVPDPAVPESLNSAESLPPAGEVPGGAEAAIPGGDAPSEEEFSDYEELTPELVEDEAIRGDFVLRWSVVLVAALLCLTPVAESGTLVHVASGRWLSAHGFIPPANDYLTISASDRRWDNLGWGFDLLAAGLVAVGGYAALTVLKTLLAGLAFWRVVHISRDDLRTWWHASAAALALLICQSTLTAQSNLVSLLGLAFTLAWLYEPRYLTSGRINGPWLLVPLFVVWSNLDPRAWMGLLAILVVWGGSIVSRTPEADELPGTAGHPRMRGSTELLRALGLATVAALINPFGWRVLSAPFRLYTHDYPAFREYLSGGTHAGLVLQYFPITDAGFFNLREPSFYATCFLFVSVWALAYLNRRRLRIADLLLLAAFTLLGFLALRELPLTSIVWAVLGGLFGQEWHRDNCRQEYTVDTRELLLSRGGRALTVIGLAAMAFLGATGRLSEAYSPTIGLGLEPQTAAAVESLRTALAACPDDHPFNARAVQGDLLIAAGGRPFIDSRLPLFRGQGKDNLVQLHGMVREALRPGRPADDPAGPGGGDAVWRTVFEKFGIRAVMPRLSGSTGLSAPDYNMLVDLLAQPERWSLTHLGPVTAVFVLRGTGDANAERVIAGSAVDFHKAAYQAKVTSPASTAREYWPEPAGFYDRYVWKRRHVVPDDILEALHLLRLAGDPAIPPVVNRERHALVLLALRKLQSGISRDTSLSAGWDALGTAYRLLMNWEGSVIPQNLGPPPAGLRYYQAVGAFGLALVANPDSEVAHANLLQLYQYAGRTELALDRTERIETLLRNRAARSEQENKSLRDQRAEILTLRVQLKKQVDAARDSLQQFAAEHPKGIEQAQYAIRLSLYRTAVKLFEENRSEWQMNLPLRLTYAILLLEQGRVRDAADEIRQIEIPSRQTGIANWREPALVVQTLQGDYDKAIANLREGLGENRRSSLEALLATLPPKGTERGRVWPIDALSVSFGALGAGYDLGLDQRLVLGVTLMEAGRCDEAAEHFREVAYGDGNLESRGLANFALSMLTGINSEVIPILFEPEP